jgi:hypothetical protein
VESSTRETSDSAFFVIMSQHIGEHQSKGKKADFNLLVILEAFPVLGEVSPK